MPVHPPTPPERPASALLSRVLNSISRLRPLPTNVSRLLRGLESPNANAATIARLLSQDQALVAYILRVANSVLLGYPQPCSSLREAIMRIGFQRLRMLVLSTATIGPLTRRLNGYRLGAGALWSHSVATGSIAHWLATRLRYPDPEEAYVAGLLHDMGKLVLDQFVQADYLQMVAVLSQRQLRLWQVEEMLFGIDHASVGGLMASRWQFPVSLEDAIRHHHAPSLARTQRELASLVNIANALTPKDDPAMADFLGHPYHPEALEILHIRESWLEQARERVMADLQEYQSWQPAPAAPPIARECGRLERDDSHPGAG